MDKNGLDISKIFQVYMVLVGDADKTALALDLPRETVEALAEEEGWADKVRRISVMSRSGTPGDWERAQNRALNFVQCHQLRRVIDTALAHLMSRRIDDVLTVTDSHGNSKPSSKILLDLAAAMQKVHEASYAALGDSVKERSDRRERDGDDPAVQAGLHQALISALNHAKLAHKPAEALVKEAVCKVKETIDCDTVTQVEPK